MVGYSTLPHAPGCYLFRDESGTILYIGKAKDLKKRVAGYFTRIGLDFKTQNLVGRVARIDFVVTTTEAEAFLLENNLIKKHQPKYNIDLKDAKRFAYLAMTKEEFPRIGIARRTDDDARYFGPFVSAAARDEILKLVKRIFSLRSCMKMPKRPCLRYHLKSCSAPCSGAISATDYRAQVENAAMLLKGRTTDLLQVLERAMAAHSARQEFEQALAIRNQIAAIQRLAERQHVEQVRASDQDVIAYREAGGEVFVMVFSFEKGRMVRTQDFTFPASLGFFEEFLARFYADRIPPPEVLLPEDPGDAVAEYLSVRRDGRVKVTVPKSGGKRKQIDLVLRNIDHLFLSNPLKVQDLMASLDLPVSPEVIECFDISHLSGTSMTGSMVRYHGGRPDKKNYRRFLIRSVAGIDDFAAIGEIVHRRYRRLIDEGRPLPDLIVIDGGRGQLSAAKEALDTLRIAIPVIALAKRDEDVYVIGDALPRRLDRKGYALKYLEEIRDEAHRFAIAYHKLLRSRNAIGKGLSPRRRRS